MITKMNHTTNEKNLSNLINLIPHFYLDPRSEHRVEQAIEDTEWPWFWNLEHNGQNRIFLPIEADARHDTGFQLYREMMLFAAEQERIPYSRYIELVRYATWKLGKTPEGEKLFKYLMKHRILTDNQVQQLTTSRNSEGDLFLVISRNPVDYLFLSTNQSFSSCVNLESEHSGAYYMGLPFYMANADTVLLFTTTGKLRTKTIKDLEFKHFGYISRAVCTWNIDLKLMIHRWYPYAPELPIEQALQDMGLATTKPGRQWETAGEFEDLFFDDGQICRPYLDIPYNPYQGHFKAFGNIGSPMNNDFCEGFEALESLDELTTPVRCSRCGRRMNEDYDDMDDDMCSQCAEEFFYCGRCRDREHGDNGYYVECEGQYICEYCRQNHYTRCSHCEELVPDEDIQMVHSGDVVCSECLRHNYTACSVCGEWFADDDNEIYEFQDAPHCARCIEEKESPDNFIAEMEEFFNGEKA